MAQRNLNENISYIVQTCFFGNLRFRYWKGIYVQGYMTMKEFLKKIQYSLTYVCQTEYRFMSAFNNDPKDLRKQNLSNKSSDEVDSLSFVHFYNPSSQKIFSELKTLIARIVGI